MAQKTTKTDRKRTERDRVLERLVVRLRASGRVSFKMIRDRVVWTATSAGQVAIGELRV